MHRVQATTRSTFQVKNLSAQFTPAGGNIHLCALTDGVSKKQKHKKMVKKHNVQHLRLYVCRLELLQWAQQQKQQQVTW